MMCGRSGRGAVLESKDGIPAFGFEHVKFEISGRHPCANIE